VKMTNPARVVFARDTRASGSRLVGVLNAALTATDVEFVDFKYMTTPQLHYVVRCKNTLGTQYEYGEPTEQGYYEKLANSFKKVMRGVKVQNSLTVDCANGVGGPKLRELMKFLTGIDIKVVNDDVINPDALNFDVCSASPQTSVSIPSTNNMFSAVPITLRLSNAPPPLPRPPRLTDAPLSTAMPIVWSTTSRMRATSSAFLMETASPLWPPLSSETSPATPASPLS